jgi:hypothetical protein
MNEALADMPENISENMVLCGMKRGIQYNKSFNYEENIANIILWSSRNITVTM